jgi:tetratricopeptide (TPR) repeat protein
MLPRSFYSKALELNPEDAVTYTCRGTVYFSQGRYQKAFVDFNRAIELNPKYSNAYINRGPWYYTKGKYARAIADYKKALELNPEGDFAKKLRTYIHYDSALFLVRVINNLSFVERPW